MSVPENKKDSEAAPERVRRVPPPVRGHDDVRLPDAKPGTDAEPVKDALPSDRVILPDPSKPTNFKEHLTDSRLRFAKQIICVSLLLVLVISVATTYIAPASGDTTMLSGALEMFKLVGTTALGFVFARSLDSKDD